MDKRGHILVDDYQNTNIPGIYAVGDVIGKALLTPGENFYALKALRAPFHPTVSFGVFAFTTLYPVNVKKIKSNCNPVQSLW